MRGQPVNLARLDEYEAVCVDVETTGLNWRADRAFGVGVAALRADGGISSGYYDLRAAPMISVALREKLPKVKRFINHHAKFDAHVLRETCGAMVPFGRVECTMVRAALLNEHEPEYNLDWLAWNHLGKRKEDIWEDMAKLFGGKPEKKAQIKNLHRAPAKLAGRYGVQDAIIALELWQKQEIDIERQGIQKIWAMERELTSILIELEQGGVRVDGALARKRLKEIEPKSQQIIKELLKLAGSGFDEKLFNSPKQKRELFKVEERDGVFYSGAMPLLRTEAGNPSIDADALRLMAETHKDERAALIIRAQKLDKARQFLQGHVLGHMEGDKVYPNYNQTKTDRGTGTGTGRFSIEDPALQQIPARDVEMAEIVRSCFIPDKRQVWLCGDWKQFEFRWFAHYVNDPELNAAYEKDPDTDFHQITADMTGLPRKPRYAGDANAKQINLGLVFGMGQGKMAAEMGLPHTVESRNYDGYEKEFYVAGPEAESIFAKYHRAIPGIKALLSQAGSIAKRRGYVMTVMERHLRFPGGKYTHKAGGLVFQGTSADCAKAKMIELYHNGHKQGDYRILLSVHDEFDFSIDAKSPKQQEIKRRLETFDGVECGIWCRIPIRSDCSVGKNWYEASK